MDYAPVNFYSAKQLKPLIARDESGDIVFQVSPDRFEVRRQICALKDKLLAASEHHVEMPVEHIIADGMYIRKLFIKKGTILVGKIHRKECLNVVALGDISVMTETGSLRVTAGYMQASIAGIQKVGYAHEDTVFMNIFRTDETDLEKIEAEIACEDYDDFPLLQINSTEDLCL